MSTTSFVMLPCPRVALFGHRTLPQPSNIPAPAPQRKRARVSASQAVIDSFQVEPFAPYISNPHVQTVLANFYPPPPTVEYTRVLLPTDDGLDVLRLDVANGTSLAPEPGEDKPVAVVLHGLESGSHGVVTLRIVDVLVQEGFKVIAMNYRSCGGEDDVPSTLKMYHAGFTEDGLTVLAAIRDSAKEAGRIPPDVYLAGFSLGSNILCVMLGQLGIAALNEYNVVAAAGACVPFDPTACQRKLDRGLSGAVYSAKLVSTMMRKFKAAQNAGVPMGAVDPKLVTSANRVGRIDAVFISPVFGFRDQFDYYQTVDARKAVGKIRVPTLIINARDDCFFAHQDGKSLPTTEQIGDAPVLLHVTENGGHCAFLDKPGIKKTRPLFFQREFARFFKHARDSKAAGMASSRPAQRQCES